jgi:hypothetical protein
LLGEVISNIKKKADSKEKIIKKLNNENIDLREKAKYRSKVSSSNNSKAVRKSGTDNSGTDR